MIDTIEQQITDMIAAGPRSNEPAKETARKVMEILSQEVDNAVSNVIAEFGFSDMADEEAMLCRIQSELNRLGL